MPATQNIRYYLAAALIFVLLKIGFTFADNNDLIFLLKPTDKIVGLLTGSRSVYLPDSGYFHSTLNIIIDKSCSGFNFWGLAFLVFSYLLFKYFEKPLYKVLSLPAALIGAYLLTIFANSARIFASITVQNQTVAIFPNWQHLIHESVGIITYLSFLIITYYLAEIFFKRKKYEKSA